MKGEEDKGVKACNQIREDQKANEKNKQYDLPLQFQ